MATKLPELHPAQQGLKVACAFCDKSPILASRTTSSTTRIESQQNGIQRQVTEIFQNYIQHNKD